MALRRLSFFTLVLLLATFILVPVRADAPKTPTGKAPLELLVHDLPAPTGVAVDPDGTVFFTDRKEGRLWQRAPNGSVTILLERLEQPRGLVRGEDGTLYFVADAFQEPQEGAQSKGVLLKRTPDDGAVSIEWEDNDAEQHAGAKAALANVRKGDLPPSGMRHDEMLKA